MKAAVLCYRILKHYKYLKMSEVRKPLFTFLLKYQAKGRITRNRIELFEATEFGYKRKGKSQAMKYRLRVNGKWFNKKNQTSRDYNFLYKSEFRDLLFRSIPFA